jgi:hypothetical protein
MPIGYAHIIPLWDAETLSGTGRNPVRGLPEGTRLTTPALAGGARADGVDAWLDKAKLHGERSRTIPQGRIGNWKSARLFAR